jgi:3-hydroxyisobutyrate dehydrogenase-like beta-hydroxyacid dehydrogenase
METNACTSTPVSLEPIGFIGLGAMGAPMARRLAGMGYRLLVHDVNPGAVRSVVDCGARAYSSVKAIASEARLVFTCLPSLDALQSVLLGDDGLHAGDAIETYVDFSTTGAEFAREIAAVLRSRDIVMLDAPITGNVITAGNGKLGIMCSGPQAAFRHAEPVMRDLASAALLYLGERNGKAQTLKLLNNLLSATGMAASCEAFILGVKAGLDPQTMLEVINSGDASSSATRNKFPRSILPRRFDFGARMAITAKDISLTVKEAEELGVPMWIGQSVRQIWKYAVSQGGSEQDGTALITYLEPWAGVIVRGTGDTAIQQPAKMTQHETGEYVFVCESPVVAVLARRLREQKWRVVVAGDDVVDQPPEVGLPHRRSPDFAERSCTLVGVAAGSSAAEWLAALPISHARNRTILNSCLMPSAQAAEVARALSDRGHDYLDALLTGTTHDIERGLTTVLAGGAAAVAEQVKPLLEAIGSRVFHVSEKPGAAQVMQQINGSLFATLLAVTSEAFVAGAKADLDPLTMTKIMGIETGRNAASARIIPEQVATRSFAHGKRIGEAERELTLASDEARSLGVTPWILDKARLLYGLAARLGSPEDDVTRLITHYERWANVEVRSASPAKASMQSDTPRMV